MTPSTRRALPLFALLALTPFGCDAPDDDEASDGSGGKGDDLKDKGICAGKVFDKTVGDDGTGLVDLSEQGDAFARLVLQADGDADSCPTSFTEIMDKLRETDKENCAERRDGIRSAVISETSQVLGKADAFRTVTTRQCGDRQAHELLFSNFGLDAKSTALPGSVEIIAFDRTNKVFAYYAIEDEQMNFFGTSLDFIKGEGGRCKQCHPAGGLNMKELAAPWVHWEGDTQTPGAQELVDKFDDLGSKTDGIELEGIVDSGNAALVDTRVKALLATNDLKQVLRPLFCTMQINIVEATSSGKTAPSSIPASPFVGNFAFDSIPVTATQYTAALKAAGQKVVGFNGTTQLKDKSGKLVTDNFFAFATIETSREDQTYLDKLVELKVIDDDFRQDVLAVDMTRPVFSDARCSLLESAPTISKLTTSTGKAVSGLPKKIKDGFVASLGSAADGSAAAQLRTHLAKVDDAADHSAAAQAFLDACKARPAAEFLTDAMKVVSLQRNAARQLPVMEFPPTLPVDTLKTDPATFFDPATCTLVTP